MFSLPLIFISAITFLALFVLATIASSASQRCKDQLDGLIPQHSSTAGLKRQELRAGRTAQWAFVLMLPLGLLCGALIEASLS